MLEAYRQYFIIGRTYVANTLINVDGSFEMRHLCTRLALYCVLTFGNNLIDMRAFRVSRNKLR